MTKYPPVSHKIPELFMLIIRADHLQGELDQRKVVKIKDWVDLKKKRMSLTKDAERFIQKQKSG